MGRGKWRQRNKFNKCSNCLVAAAVLDEWQEQAVDLPEDELECGAETSKVRGGDPRSPHLHHLHRLLHFLLPLLLLLLILVSWLIFIWTNASPLLLAWHSLDCNEQEVTKNNLS